MKRSPEKCIAVAGVMTVLALSHQLQVSQWIYAGMAGFAGIGATLWFTLEKRVATWMPDSEFPNWLLNQMT